MLTVKEQRFIIYFRPCDLLASWDSVIYFLTNTLINLFA